MRKVFVLGVLIFLVACGTTNEDGIGGGEGERLVLECSAAKPCPEGYQCVAPAGQTQGNCQKVRS